MKKLLIASAALILFIGICPFSAAAQRKAWVAPKAGVWKVKATDEENTRWTATLRISKRGIGSRTIRYRGYFDWLSDDKEISGREYFTGTFTRSSGKLRLKAYAVKNVRGELGIGNYVASVNRKGRNINRGTWSGVDNVPGKWTAAWIKFR